MVKLAVLLAIGILIALWFWEPEVPEQIGSFGGSPGVSLGIIRELKELINGN